MRARRKRMLKLLLALTSLAATLLVAEGALRFLLFSPAARRMGIGWRIRNEGLYTAREGGRETWQLRTLLEENGARTLSPRFDARFGWLSGAIDRATLAHHDERRIGGRTPVLLFGDSYAECVSSAIVCWQDLLEESPLSAGHRLLNYGVGGYGLDQAFLLSQAVLDEFAASGPIVVIGVLVDDDMDRCYLPLRSFPKPWFTVQAGELVLHPVEHADALEYARAHPLGIRSYVWRWFLFGSGLIPRASALALTPESDHVAAKESINRALIVALQRSLAQRGLRHFFLLFHARRSLSAPGHYGWQEPFLIGVLEELGIPYVSSKRYLRAHLAESGGSIDDFYLASGSSPNHYTELANRIVFQALEDGLQGRFEPAVKLR